MKTSLTIIFVLIIAFNSFSLGILIHQHLACSHAKLAFEQSRTILVYSPEYLDMLQLNYQDKCFIK